MDDFPGRLRRLRERNRPVKSMIVTGGLMGLKSPSMLRRYERGEAEPTLTALKKIARYYHVSIDYLAGMPEKK